MRLYNSLSLAKENFSPIKDKEVKMYVCGITPYDTTHLGHAFTYMFFDVLQRYIQFQGYKVTYTQNVTDIDDDILKRARQENQNWKTLGEYWTNKFLTDMKALNIKSPTYFVKATESIPTIIEIAEKLLKDKYAYTRDGNVYFSVKKDNEYGKLSKYTRAQMLILSKERGANPNDPRKKDPLDFILWQRSEPDEPSWKSPWGLPAGRQGAGRPGWHIECSAMVYEYLGERIDIHGGGRDLIYPHHESEVAQSETFTGKKPFAKYWLHTGIVMYCGEKMSKSLGNLVLVSDLLKKYSGNALRYMLLSHHYRHPWEYSELELVDAEKNIAILKNALLQNPKVSGSQSGKKIVRLVKAALANDMNTPKALEVLTSSAKRQLAKPVKSSQDALKEVASLLGFNI